jgi:DNA-binding NarL/FixJ family response regulator
MVKKRSEVAEEFIYRTGNSESHIKNIYTKLDVHSRSKAIDFARKNKLI